jgi:hypothetical protein
VGAFGAEGGVVAVARVDPGLVGEPVEHLVLDLVDQAGELAGGVGFSTLEGP